jgi:LPS O-antigen subunit length determinant protein (WzzB/FepE family)
MTELNPVHAAKAVGDIGTAVVTALSGKLWALVVVLLAALVALAAVRIVATFWPQDSAHR